MRISDPGRAHQHISSERARHPLRRLCETSSLSGLVEVTEQVPSAASAAEEYGAVRFGAGRGEELGQYWTHSVQALTLATLYM